MVLVRVLFACLVASAMAGKLEDNLKTKAEEIGTKTLGVAVTIGSLDIFAWKTKVIIEDLEIANPPGYNSPHLLKTGKVMVDVHAGKALKSRGSEIVIEDLEVTCLEVVYQEKVKMGEGSSGVWGGELTTSNVKEVMNKVQSDSQQPETPAEEEEEKKESSVYLQKVNITGVEAKVQIFGTPPGTIALADIQKDDFSKEMGEMGIPKVIEILMQTILRSVLANVMGLVNKLGGNQPKTCFEKRSEAAAAAAAEKKKGWGRKFAVAAKAAWQDDRLTHPIVFSSIAVLMGMFGVAAWRRHRRPAPHGMSMLSTENVDAGELCDEANE